MRFDSVFLLWFVAAVTIFLFSIISSNMFWNNSIVRYRAPGIPKEFCVEKSKTPGKSIELGLLLECPKEWESGAGLFRDCHRKGWERGLDNFVQSGELKKTARMPIDSLPSDKWTKLHSKFAYNSGVYQFEKDAKQLLKYLECDLSTLHDKCVYKRKSFRFYWIVLFTCWIPLMLRRNRR